MNKIIKKGFLFLFWIYVFVLLIFNGGKYLDADFGWHLRVGEDISKTKAAPDIEYYDYTLEGQSWVDHEWGLNYISYLIFENFGYFSLIIFYALIALLSFYLLYLFVLKKYYIFFERNFLLQVLLLLFILLGVYASFPHLGVRMQEFTFLNIILLLFILDKFISKKSYKVLFFLPLLFFVWANIHAGFLIGLFLLLMWLGVKCTELISFKHKQFYFLNYKNVLDNKYLLIFILFIGLSFLATLVNPYGVSLYSFLNSYSNDYYLKHIVEWLPVYYLPILYKQIAYDTLSLVVVLIFLVFAFFGFRYIDKEKYKISLWEISLYVLFLYLALKSKRHFPLFFAVSLPFVFSLYINLFNESFLELKKNINFRIVSFFAISVLLILIIGQSSKINFINNPFNQFCGKFPCGAVEYLDQNKELQEKRVFNDYGWGGYLIWTLPDMKLFIDGRLPQFEYKGQSMLEEYRDFYVSETMESKLAEHGIEMVFMKTSFNEVKLNWFEKYFLLLDEEKINTQKNNLKEHLDTSGEWSEVYMDEISSIYVKI